MTTFHGTYLNTNQHFAAFLSITVYAIYTCKEKRHFHKVDESHFRFCPCPSLHCLSTRDACYFKTNSEDFLLIQDPLKSVIITGTQNMYGPYAGLRRKRKSRCFLLK